MAGREEPGMELVYSVFLLCSGWYDMKTKKIPVWILVFFGILGIVNMAAGRGFAAAGEIAAAFLPGISLLLLTLCTRGAAGMGDGCFFIVSAFYLGYAEIITLFIYGLLFCGTCSLGMMAWGIVHGIRIGKMRLPLLPFIVLAWLWILFFRI